MLGAGFPWQKRPDFVAGLCEARGCGAVLAPAVDASAAEVAGSIPAGPLSCPEVLGFGAQCLGAQVSRAQGAGRGARGARRRAGARVGLASAGFGPAGRATSARGCAQSAGRAARGACDRRSVARNKKAAEGGRRARAPGKVCLRFELRPAAALGRGVACSAPARARRCSALRGRFRGFGASGLGFLKLLQGLAFGG